MPTNPVFAVILFEILLLAFNMTVKGPGQNLSVNDLKTYFVSSSISTNSKAWKYEVTWTITGSDSGRSVYIIRYF